MASITPDRVEAVRRDIAQALALTSGSSTLPEAEQERLLTQSCVEACEVLTDWLQSDWFGKLSPEGDGPLLECVAHREDLEKFLNLTFRDVLAKARLDGDPDPGDYIGKALDAVAQTGGLHRTMRRMQLFDAARNRVIDLQQGVCGLAKGRIEAAARHDESQANKRARKRRMRSALKAASGALLPLALAMTAVTPHLAGVDVGAWIEPVKAVMLHGIAAAAQPGLQIAPSHAGPHLHF